MTPAADQSLPAVLVEAFTAVPCQGNGAAVVLLPHPASEAWMQALARSLNQSETAFLLACPGGWALRWFTPTCEVPLCGHATLAALLALNHWRPSAFDGQTTFSSRSGPLPVSLDGDLAQICLPTGRLQGAETPAYLSVLLQTQPQAFWRSALGYSVALLEPAFALQTLNSPSSRLQAAEASGLVLMQALDGRGGDAAQVAGQRANYQLRFFAPGLGIDEDPVTGSAHALVAPYWLQRLGQTRVVGWQCSPRPGGMACEAASSGMIRLSGTGVLLWSGNVQMQPDHSATASTNWQALWANG